MVAQQFIDQHFPVRRVLKHTDLSASAYYYKPKDGVRGAAVSKYTYTLNGQKVCNSVVVKQIEIELGREFVDYGYIKVTHWLRQTYQYKINFKKVYRLMKVNALLYGKRPAKHQGRNWVKDLVPEPEETFHYLEFDIKYIYIHGLRKNAMLLTVIDVDSRLTLAQMLQLSIKKEDVVALFTYIKQNFTLPQKVTVRSDNGSQFVAQLLRNQLIEMKINQEFTKPATPEQNAHIESYHSIVERTICQKYQFGSLSEANETFDRFQKFYNHERIHSGIGYTSPMKYLQAKGFIISNPDFTFITT